MERHRGDHQRHHELQHPNFNQHHPDQNQFNNHNHSHYNFDSNQQMSGEANEPFSGGLFRPNGRKRGRFHSSDYGDGGVNAKLYIAPIPRTTTEENIRSLFEEHGSVVEVVLPRDKRTGQQQAYCFVKYATFEEADRAIRALHNQHTIPGEVAPFKVRYADGERERPVPRCSMVGGFVDKLYVGSINKLASKQEIEEIFSPYGHVEDVYIARDELKQSRGCAFVKFSHRDMALAAIKGLNGTLTMRGCDQPLIVRFADPKKPKTGELRGSFAFGGPNFGPCFQQPMIRPAPGCVLPNASFSMQQTSTTGVPQAVAHAAKQELASPHITEQPLSSVKHSPSQLSQMPLQHMQAPEKCFPSPQQTIFETHKQTQILEQQQNQQIALQEPTWTGNTQPASCNSVTSAVPPSPQIVDPGECDWSEHFCPDGYKYYYNCITNESRWEKPVEITLFLQQFQEQKRLHGSNQQSSLSPVCSAEEVDQTHKELDRMQIQSETSPVIDPSCV